MKKLFTLILVIVFVMQSTVQVWIIASFYINRDYISTTLCINRFEEIPTCKGQCFLDNELKESEKKQKEELPNLKQKEVQLIFTSHSLVSNTRLVYLLKPETPRNKKQNRVLSKFVFSIFHPPKIA